MERNEFKKVRIKNCTCYYFDDLIKLEDFDIDNIAINKESNENILIYEILCKTLIEAKTLRITFEEIDGFIRTYDRTRYLVLSGSYKFDALYDITRYLISLKSVITYVFSRCYAKIKVDSD